MLLVTSEFPLQLSCHDEVSGSNFRKKDCLTLKKPDSDSKLKLNNTFLELQQMKGSTVD